MMYLCYILHHIAFIAFTEIGCIKPVYSGMPIVYRYKASAFLFSCMHWQWNPFCEAWSCHWFSTCLHLATPLQCCNDLQLLMHFL